ncbi:hypothetical protein HOLleu_35848 [Holothuria leucospilota]|uniref:Uncharacterized protein n=1 Tax=Holothuria leucospilota TaxID=206669 RepID=A0A9Q0YJ27_HOLLE|nr:hypothetical protein HOLleu_35848 [Holothuria leucospilota]
MLIKQKQEAFKSNDLITVKLKQKEIKQGTKHSKYLHGKKLEEKFQLNDSSAAWKVMSSVTGHKHKQSVNTDVSKHFVNELHGFYSRFDAIDFKDEQSSLSAMLNNECNIFNQIVLNEIDVYHLYCNVKVNKAWSR